MVELRLLSDVIVDVGGVGERWRCGRLGIAQEDLGVSGTLHRTMPAAVYSKR